MSNVYSTKKILVYNNDGEFVGFLHLEDACRIHKIDFETANTEIMSSGLFCSDKVSFSTRTM